MAKKKPLNMTKGNVLRILISKTANGQGEYLQVMSPDMVSINIVLVADRFELEDKR